MSTHDVEAEVEALRAKVERVQALPDQWQGALYALGQARMPGTRNARSFIEDAIRDLRAALNTTPTGDPGEAGGCTDPDRRQGHCCGAEDS